MSLFGKTEDHFISTCFYYPPSKGATLFVIGSHAAFRELENSEMEELLMEQV